MEVPLVDKDYLLERTPGNGGWTYAPIPEVPQDKKAPFGWVKVKGSIDGVEIKKHHLMPMGNGELGLSVKAESVRRSKSRRVIMYMLFCTLMKSVGDSRRTAIVFARRTSSIGIFQFTG